MPIISAVGKRSPQSTTTMRSSYSTTVRFFPIADASEREDAQLAAHAAWAPQADPGARAPCG